MHNPFFACAKRWPQPRSGEATKLIGTRLEAAIFFTSPNITHFNLSVS
jgi:hypothetical protein